MPALTGLLLVSLMISGAAAQADREEPVADSMLETAFHPDLFDGINAFGYDFFSGIAQDEPGNVFISPLSVSLALGMAAHGASGQTQRQIWGALGLADVSEDTILRNVYNLIEYITELDEDIDLRLANSIWIRKGFPVERDYVTRNEAYFGAEVGPLDKAEPINRWVSEKTNGLIDQMVSPPLPADAMLYLLNAVYFKGEWASPFDPKQTYDGQFYPDPGGDGLNCRMMRQESKFHFVPDERYQAIDLPYGHDRAVATIVLPGPQFTIDDLLADGIGPIMAAMAEAPMSKVRLELPRFELKYDRSLNDDLQRLGITDAFSEQHADFSRMSEDAGLFISEVKHKSYVKLDEEGTEAAAVTGITVRVTAFNGEQTYAMRVDRPFLFLIRDQESGLILFIGRVKRPVV
jgi:serpin B